MLFFQLLIPLIEAGRVQDLRGDACDRAIIPWSPFTTHARLDPAALSRIIARTDHSRFLETREAIVLHTGPEEVIVVDYEVLLSDASLQKKVTLTQLNNDVAFVINGTAVGSIVQRECVVAVTHVYLPKTIHHFIVDAQASNVVVDSVKGSFDILEFLLKAGNVRVHDSALQIGSFVAELQAGGIEIDGGLAAKSQRISTHAGQVSGNLIQGQETVLHSNAGSIRVTLEEPSDRSHLKQPRKIEVSTEAGSITLNSRLLRPANIQASAKYGAVTVSVLPQLVAKVHLEAQMGHVAVPKALVVTSDKHTWTSRTVEGYLGRSEDAASVTVRASSKAGSVTLIVPEDDVKKGL